MRLSDAAFRNLTRGAAILVLILLGGVIAALIKGSLPALQAFGFASSTRSLESGHREVRRLRADLRHVVTSVIAMVIAVPLGL